MGVDIYLGFIYLRTYTRAHIPNSKSLASIAAPIITFMFKTIEYVPICHAPTGRIENTGHFIRHTSICSKFQVSISTSDEMLCVHTDRRTLHKINILFFPLGAEYKKKLLTNELRTDLKKLLKT